MPNINTSASSNMMNSSAAEPMTKTDSLETGKIVVALRTARAAAGWSQEEFAQLMGVAKTTVARIETLEMSVRAEYLSKALRLFNEAGIEVDMTQPDSVPIKVSMRAVPKAVDDLQDVNKRRKDRRIGVADRREGSTELLAIKGV